MPADAINYSFLAKELNSTLNGGRIDKIVMSDKSSLMIVIRAGGKNHNLLITAAASPRCYISKDRITSTPVPLSFCLHLRRHITGGSIRNITTLPFERILQFELLTYGDLGEPATRYLIVEIMGKYSNVILTDANFKITDALKHIPLDEQRPIIPGLTYSAPSDVSRFYPTDRNAAETIMATTPESDLPSVLVKRMLGLSLSTAKEIIALSNGKNVAEGTELLLAKTPAPVCYYEGEKPVDFAFCDYTVIGGETKHFETLSEAMDEYYSFGLLLSEKAAVDNVIKRTLSSALDKHRKKLAAFTKDYANAEDFDKDRILGELITANMYKIKNGDTSVTVDNWYTGEQQTIKLTEQSPQQNAQKYFKRYQKKKRTLASLQSLIDETKATIDYLESVDAALSMTSTIEDSEELLQELEDQGYAVKQNKKKAVTESQPRKYTISGFTVLIGKNNTQNDKITKEARGEDIWLHTQGFHGSHVIIKAMGKEVPSSVITKAAEYAAFFSKARLSENVPVDYTKAKNVYKKRGAAPGKVDYFGAKTVYVNPAQPVDNN